MWDPKQSMPLSAGALWAGYIPHEWDYFGREVLTNSDARWKQIKMDFLILVIQGPAQSHMRLGLQTLRRLAPGRWNLHQSGYWEGKGHKLWECAYNIQQAILLCSLSGGEGWEVYMHNGMAVPHGWQCHYIWTNQQVEELKADTVDSVKIDQVGQAILLGTVIPIQPSPIFQSFKDVLHFLGGNDYRSLTCQDKTLVEEMTQVGALEHDIQEGCLIKEMDGSFIKEMITDLCTASMILEFQQGKGKTSSLFLRKEHRRKHLPRGLFGTLSLAPPPVKYQYCPPQTEQWDWSILWLPGGPLDSVAHTNTVYPLAVQTCRHSQSAYVLQGVYLLQNQLPPHQGTPRQ